MPRPTPKAKPAAWAAYADELELERDGLEAEVGALEAALDATKSGELVRQLRRRIQQLTRGRV